MFEKNKIITLFLISKGQYGFSADFDTITSGKVFININKKVKVSYIIMSNYNSS